MEFSGKHVGKLLGIDYGSRRIGLALSDDSGTFALPHAVISAADDPLTNIAKLCEQEQISTVVIGESKDFSGVDNPIMVDARTFAEKLRKKLAEKLGQTSGTYIVFHPEFLTSAQAERGNPRRLSGEVRISKKESETPMLDASAAAIMLQSYIDTSKNNQ